MPAGPDIRFHVGAPLIGEAGHPLGALCGLDDKARGMPDDARIEALVTLARQAIVAAARRRLDRPAV